MEQINELSVMLNQHFKWNKARMDCFVGMLIGLLKTRTINLIVKDAPRKLGTSYALHGITPQTIIKGVSEKQMLMLSGN
jgi:hypothetical protein